MKSIYYFGEIQDYSDRWLLYFLKKYFHITRIDPSYKVFPRRPCDIIINRLYGSAYNRYGEEKISRLLKEIKRLEAKGIPSINSTTGYTFDLNRVGQYAFFYKHHVPFVKTVMANSVLSRKDKIKFPCVIKSNTFSRSKNLTIIRNRDAIRGPSSVIYSDPVLQSLIRIKTCYRTEFIGSDCFTFTQLVKFNNNRLNFEYTKEMVNTPLKPALRDKLVGLMVKLGVKVFSVEYFLKSGQPSIVDFNMTSNYRYFFISQTRGRLSSAWLDIIEHGII